MTNLDRAIKFYSAVRGNEVRRMLEARTVFAPSSSTRKASRSPLAETLEAARLDAIDRLGEGLIPRLCELWIELAVIVTRSP